MSQINIEFSKAIHSSEEIISTASKIKNIHSKIGGVKLDGILEGVYTDSINRSIRAAVNSLSGEAVKMKSLGSALELIAQKYKQAEQEISNESQNANSSESSRTEVTDKRSWWQKFWDWITGRTPGDNDKTSSEMEKAADLAMKKKLWNILQDEKYSQSHWDKASVDERKLILQEYMTAVIAVYGLSNIKPNINWDNNATYTNNSITWGYYNHGSHTVTLNERALTDSCGNWDSYDLLETVSHELRHAYQHEAVDNPTKFTVSQETIDTWNDNFKHYISSSDNYQAYRDQPVEVDARDFQVNRNDRY